MTEKPGADDLLAIRDAFGAALAGGQPLDAALDRVLAATSSRAVGLWRLQGDRLLLLGFRGVPDMAPNTAQDFEAATREVPLVNTGFGIVQASLQQRSIPAYRGDSALPASAGWIERFGAAQSLSAPAVRDGRVVGVLAVSAPSAFHPGSPTWSLIERLAEALGPTLARIDGK